MGGPARLHHPVDLTGRLADLGLAGLVGLADRLADLTGRLAGPAGPAGRPAGPAAAAAADSHIAAKPLGQGPLQLTPLR